MIKKKYPKKEYIIFSIPLGVAVGAIFDMEGVGAAIGTLIWVSLYFSIKSKY